MNKGTDWFAKPKQNQREKNKYILLGILLFPFIIGIYCGRFLSNEGLSIEKWSWKAIDKYGNIIVKKLKLKNDTTQL